MSFQNWSILVLLSVIWGGSFIFTEIALTGFAPFTLVCARLALASAVVIALVYAKGLSLPRDKTLWGRYFLLGLMQNALPFSLVAWGQTQITGSAASILNATTPIFTLLIAHAMTKDERLSSHKLLGVFTGFAGVYIMMKPAMVDGLSLVAWGQLAILGSSVFYAFSTVFAKRLIGMPPLISAACTLLCASLVMLPPAVMMDTAALAPGFASIAALAGLALLGTVTGFLLYFKVLASAGAVNFSMVTYMIPVSAMVLGFLVLGERVHVMTLYGMAVIFAGLALIDGRLWRRFYKPAMAAGE